MKAADDIYDNQRVGGAFSNYMDNQLDAIKLSEALE